MLCQQCHERDANVHFTQIINGNMVKMYLCSQCADVKGHFAFSPQLNLGDFLWGIPNFIKDDGFKHIEKPVKISCDVCGLSLDDFRSTGKLGCPNCYKVFRDNLNPILRRLHGNTEHVGKAPGKVSHCIKYSDELEKLRGELAEAISREEYEKAAGLRDQIRGLEGTEDKCGGVI